MLCRFRVASTRIDTSVPADAWRERNFFNNLVLLHQNPSFSLVQIIGPARVVVALDANLFQRGQVVVPLDMNNLVKGAYLRHEVAFEDHSVFLHDRKREFFDQFQVRLEFSGHERVGAMIINHIRVPSCVRGVSPMGQTLNLAQTAPDVQSTISGNTVRK